MVAHIAVVFRDRDAGVDAGLAGRHRHVGGVGDKHRAFDKRIPALRVLEFRELLQDLRHLVAALAAADVNDNVGVAPFGELVLRNSFSGAEAARDSGGAASGDREEEVDDSLSGEERHVRFEPALTWPRVPDGPLLRQAQHSAVFQTADLVFYRVFPFRGQANKFSLLVGRDHDLVGDQAAFGHFADYVAAVERVADLDRRHEMPLLFLVEFRYGNAAADEGSGLFIDAVQRTLNAVVETAQKPRAQFHGKRAAQALDDVAGLDVGRVLVHLDGAHVAFLADDLAREIQLANKHLLAHAELGGVGGGDGRAVHAIDRSQSCLSLFHCYSPSRRMIRSRHFSSLFLTAASRVQSTEILPFGSLTLKPPA